MPCRTSTHMEQIPKQNHGRDNPVPIMVQKNPDVSHLRIWGCTAYVHTQKDKCSSLSPHMERCAFIGYPEGIKGWKFIIPKTRHTIVSERTEFDERHFLYKLVDQDQTVPLTSTQLL